MRKLKDNEILVDGCIWETRKGKKYNMVEPSQEYTESKKPKQEEIDKQSNDKIINELNNTNPELMEILEDIVYWAEKEGFTLSEKKKELMNSRKSKRSELK